MGMITIGDPGGAAISSIAYSAHGLLLSSSWDGCARVYDTSYKHAETYPSAGNAPLLDCAWLNASTAVFGGLDGNLDCVQMGGRPTRLGKHKDAISAIATLSDRIISGSWDKSVKITDARSGSSVETQLLEKVFCLDAVDDRVVVATANRAIWIYDARQMSQPFEKRESSLKYSTRCVTCNPNGSGYVTSSIEGRVAVELFDPSPESQEQRYAFKCHRQNDDASDETVAYPINDVQYHPVHGTFATAGGDGVVAIWDAAARKRLRQYPRLEASVASIAFSQSGRHLAMACSSGIEDGRPDDDSVIALHIRELAVDEGRPKVAASTTSIR